MIQIYTGVDGWHPLLCLSYPTLTLCWNAPNITACHTCRNASLLYMQHIAQQSNAGKHQTYHGLHVNVRQQQLNCIRVQPQTCPTHSLEVLNVQVCSQA